MNDAWGYEGNENQQGEPGNNDGPKALRDAYAALKAQNELILQKLAETEKERATEKLANVFTELGVPGAASVYTGEPDPEKAKAWVQSMQAAFGTGNTQSGAQGDAQNQGLDPETQQNFQQMTEAGQGSGPLGGMAAYEAAIGNADSIEALIAANAAARNQA
jgi:hypothetical protein